MTEYLKAKWRRLLSHFRPIYPVIQPAHIQIWDAMPRKTAGVSHESNQF